MCDPVSAHGLEAWGSRLFALFSKRRRSLGWLPRVHAAEVLVSLCFGVPLRALPRAINPVAIARHIHTFSKASSAVMLAFMVFVVHPMTGFVKVDAVPQTNPVRELYLALPRRRQQQR